MNECDTVLMEKGREREGRREGERERELQNRIKRTKESERIMDISLSIKQDLSIYKTRSYLTRLEVTRWCTMHT